MTEPAPATPRPARRFPRWVARLGRSGVPEAIVGLFAYMYNEAFPSIDGNRTLAEAILRGHGNSGRLIPVRDDQGERLEVIRSAL